MAYIDRPRGFHAAGFISGAPTPEVRYRKLDVNQTIAAGDLLIMSAGYLQIAAATSVVLIGLAVEPIVASASVYQQIGYIPLLPGLIIEGQCSGTMTEALFWTACDIEGTTGIMEVNEDSTSYGVIVPFELVDETEGVGANAYVRCFVKKSIWNISA